MCVVQQNCWQAMRNALKNQRLLSGAVGLCGQLPWVVSHSTAGVNFSVKFLQALDQLSPPRLVPAEEVPKHLLWKEGAARGRSWGPVATIGL